MCVLCVYLYHQVTDMGHKTYRLTKEDAMEVLHKLTALAESPDLLDDYGLTEQSVRLLILTVPGEGGGEWTIDDSAILFVSAEMENHADLLRGIASDARKNNEPGQALRIAKQAKRLETIFAA